MKKLDTAFRDMDQLTIGAHKRRANLTELVKEIDLVLVYLDRSKDLWESDATRGEERGAPDHHSDRSESVPPEDSRDTEQGQ